MGIRPHKNNGEEEENEEEGREEAVHEKPGVRSARNGERHTPTIGALVDEDTAPECEETNEEAECKKSV